MLLVVTVCSGCTWSRPPYPPTIDPNVYDIVVNRPAELDPGGLYISVAGARLARGGDYVPLIVSGTDSEKRARWIVGGACFFWPDADMHLASLSLDDGTSVALLRPEMSTRDLDIYHPWWAPLVGALSGPQITAETMAPETYLLESTVGSASVLQPMPFRTEEQLSPGWYMLSLTEGWRGISEKFEREINASDAPVIDTTAHRLWIDWRHEITPTRGEP